jgi:hypothetical protein
MEESPDHLETDGLDWAEPKTAKGKPGQKQKPQQFQLAIN